MVSRVSYLPYCLYLFIITLDKTNKDTAGYYCTAHVAHRRKLAASAIFLHTNQHKIFQGTLGTQDLTSIGSKTSHGPLMDPTGPLK